MGPNSTSSSTHIGQIVDISCSVVIERGLKPSSDVLYGVNSASKSRRRSNANPSICLSWLTSIATCGAESLILERIWLSNGVAKYGIIDFRPSSRFSDPSSRNSRSRTGTASSSPWTVPPTSAPPFAAADRSTTSSARKNADV